MTDSGNGPEYWEEFSRYSEEQRAAAQEAYRHTTAGQAQEFVRLVHEIVDPVVTAFLSIVNGILRVFARWLSR